MKVAIYCRVSTEDQAEKQTIENQIQFAEKYVDLHELDVYTYYREDGVTGTIPLHDRPEGTRLLQDAKENNFDTLLIYKLDRLGRSARIILNSIHELEALGIQIKSMTEPFDTSSPAGRFMITMLAGVADLERETILERMWHGANRAARDGKWLGGIVPYGYFVNENKELEINNNPIEGFSMSEPEIIKTIFDKIGNEQWSTVKVCDYLNDLGLPTSYTKSNRKIKSSDGKRKIATANKWLPGNISRIARNTTYKGIHFYGKRSKKEREIIERAVPAIVDIDLWERVQRQLKDNQLESMKNKTRDYLLSSLIKCGECGITYIGINYKKIGKAYYSCGGKKKYKGPIDICPSKNIPTEETEEIIWNDCLYFINHPGKAIEEIEKNIKSTKESFVNIETEINLLESSLRKKDSEKESILDLYRKKIIDSKDVELQLLSIKEEKEKLQSRIKELEEQKKSSDDLLASVNSATEFLSSLKEKSMDADFKTKREIVKALIKSIKVVTDNSGPRKKATLEVEYNFSGSHQSQNNINSVNHTDIRVVNTFDNPKDIIENLYSTNNIYIIRKKLNLSVKDFADLCGVAEETISKYETTNCKLSMKVLKKVASIINEEIFYIGKYYELPEENLPEKLYKAMKYHGHTYKDCAKDIGVDPQTISKILKGHIFKQERIKIGLEKYIDTIYKKK